jgi:hypothetical protein
MIKDASGAPPEKTEFAAVTHNYIEASPEL